MFASLFLFISLAAAQQRADTSFVPNVEPLFPPGAGPVIHLDHAHHNFHRLDGRYQTFAAVLSKAGFQPRPFDSPFTPESLRPIRVLVIANALSPENEKRWTLPTHSAFTPSEITALREWIERGGSLFLIADHMPFPGCAANLAQALGIEFSNGYAAEPNTRGPILFEQGRHLHPHPVTQGISQVATFTGSAFRGPGITPILSFSENATSALVQRASNITPTTPRQPIPGWLQGGLLTRQKGKIAVFGEASMFSAQISASGQQMGMNHPAASHNALLLVRLIHWLSR